MRMSVLEGEQYVRLGPGAAEKIAPYTGIAAAQIEELVLDLARWPQTIRPLPRRSWDGRLLAGDPVLIDANDAGLTLAGEPVFLDANPATVAFVAWKDVRGLRVLSRDQQRSSA